MKLADVKTVLAKAAPRLRTPVVDLVGLVGAGLVVAGVNLIYQPAAFILAGLALLVSAILLQRRKS